MCVGGCYYPTTTSSSLDADARLTHPVGIWRIPENQNMDELSCAPKPFYFDGDTVTMRLIALKDWSGKSVDNCYKLKTTWKGNTLYWLPPFGHWEPLATLVNGRFQVNQDGVLWVYEKVERSSLDEQDRPLVDVRRILHDYSK